MTDVEGNPPLLQGGGAAGGPMSNPYSSNAQPLLPPGHPLNKLKRLVYMGISGYGLEHFDFYHAILKSPRIRHEWFKIGLAGTIALLGLKAYVELYEGKIRKQTVNYKNYPRETHAVIGLFLLTSVAFHIALWPLYGWNSPLVLGICFFGIIFQFLLLVPTSVQNAVGFVLLTFFLQQYQ